MRSRICKFGLVSLVLMLSIFCSCTDSQNNLSENSDAEEVKSLEAEEMFSEKDLNAEYDAEEYEVIELCGTSAITKSAGVEVSGSVVTVTSPGKYIFTGSLEDGYIVVAAEKTENVYLVFQDVSIVSSDYACLYISQAKKVFLNLEGENKLTTSEAFMQRDDNTVDGTIFAKDNITIYGTGSLILNSSKHGIAGKDDVKITGGTIRITAAGHGIEAKDSLRITSTLLSIVSQGDGLHCENDEDSSLGYIYIQNGTLNIETVQDGISCGSILQVEDGELTIKTEETSALTSAASVKGMKAQTSIIIQGGSLEISSADDCIHSNGNIEIAGGGLWLRSKDDGIHADDTLRITSGEIEITESYEGLEAEKIEISGGDISVIASDDGINAAGGNDLSSVNGRPGQNSFAASGSSYIHISGGSMYINASGDGIDSNGSLEISGGYIVIEGPTDNGNGALDYDGTGTITGGTIIAIGYSGMAMNFSEATQGSILLTLSSIQKPQTKIVLCDSGNQELVSFTASKAYNSVLISCAGLMKGSAYTITAGTETKSITLSALIYGSTQTSGMAPGGSVLPGGRR